MEADVLGREYLMAIELYKTLRERFSEYDTGLRNTFLQQEEQARQIEEKYEAMQQHLQSVTKNRKQVAQEEYEQRQKRFSDYKSRADKAWNEALLTLQSAVRKTMGDLSAGNYERCEQNMRPYLEMLQAQSREREECGKPDDNVLLAEMCQSTMKLYGDLENKLQLAGRQAKENLASTIQFFENKQREESAQNQASRMQELAALRNERSARVEQIHGQLIAAVRDSLQPERQAEAYRTLQQTVPQYATFQPAREFPEEICFGYAGLDVTRDMEDELKRDVLRQRFGFALEKDGAGEMLKIPYGYSLSDRAFSTLFEYTKETRQEAIEILRNLVMELLTKIPCGKARFTFVDPVDLGNTFAQFNRLGEVDERIIDTRTWSDENRIEERLGLIVDHTEDIIQRCLQGRYKNIIEYNASAKKNAEPLRFLVVMDFPRHFTDKALDRLESIISKGPQNGVFTILAGDKSELSALEGQEALRRIREQMNCIRREEDHWYTSYKAQEDPVIFWPLPGPEKQQAQSCIDLLRKGIQDAEHVVITYDDVSDSLLQKPDYWFYFDAQNGLSVPIGLEGAGKPVELKLGGVNQGGKKRPFHAMVAGDIGSGKSSMLHTIIMSTLLHYSPEDVKLYLLDFKRGIEFKCYADAGLANFRTIAIDTEPEFGLAVLRDLEREEARRSACFREEGVDRIEAYREVMARRGIVHHNMPRLLVVFDEYQELFHDAEDPIVRECAQLLSRVVLQAGSAMGIHMILATQDVSNVKGLDAALYGQFETRIALKCNEQTSRTILSSDNEAAGQLVTADAGQAVFNDATGHKDYNRMFRGAFLSPEERLKILKKIHDMQQDMLEGPVQPPRLLLSSVQDDTENLLNRFVESGTIANGADPSIHLYVGESLSMVNTFRPALWNRPAQNLLLAGRNQGKARQICSFAAISLIYEMIRLEGGLRRPFITLFDFSGNSLSFHEEKDLLSRVIQDIPEVFRVFDKNQVVEGLQILQQELAQGEQHFVFFFGLNRARRLLTASSFYDQLPREILVDLLRRGPANGMNFIVWANDPALYMENYSDTLECFEHRFGFDMAPEEFNAILNQVIRQGKEGKIAEEGSQNAIAFDMNDENQKIRLYGTPTEEWLIQFVKNCRAHLE